MPVTAVKTIQLKLYLAGEGPNSVKALTNLRSILDGFVNWPCDLEVIDALTDPERTLRDGVLVTPTLKRISPGPVVTLVGDLRNRDEVMRMLGLESPDAKK